MIAVTEISTSHTECHVSYRYLYLLVVKWCVRKTEHTQKTQAGTLLDAVGWRADKLVGV